VCSCQHAPLPPHPAPEKGKLGGRCVLMPACPSPTTPRTGDAVRATLLQLTLHRLCRSGGEASLLDAIRTGLRFKTSMGATFLRELKELVRIYSVMSNQTPVITQE
jgi:hypothetical protein